ncbi:hypothetical protein GCM10009662_03670 [Catellatospora coxensis]
MSTFSHSSPSSIIEITLANWPWARLSRFRASPASASFNRITRTYPQGYDAANSSADRRRACSYGGLCDGGQEAAHDAADPAAPRSGSGDVLGGLEVSAACCLKHRG